MKFSNLVYLFLLNILNCIDLCGVSCVFTANDMNSAALLGCRKYHPFIANHRDLSVKWIHTDSSKLPIQMILFECCQKLHKMSDHLALITKVWSPSFNNKGMNIPTNFCCQRFFAAEQQIAASIHNSIPEIVLIAQTWLVTATDRSNTAKSRIGICLFFRSRFRTPWEILYQTHQHL